MADHGASAAPEAPTEGAAIEQDDFSAAFAERHGADSEGGGQKDGEAPADPSAKEPAEAGSEAPADAAAEPDASGAKAPAAFDPWTGLTPEQKSHFEQLQQSERSQRGRVGALTKKLHTISAAPPAPTPAPTQKEGQEQGDKSGQEAEVSDLDKRLQAVVDEYGDVVGPIAEILTEVRSQIAGLQKPAATESEIDADAEEIAKAQDELMKVHPDFQTVAGDSNFTAWLGDQPKKMVDLANSYDPEEVSLVLSLYKAERAASLASQSGEGGEPGKQESTAADDKRRRQLEGSRQVPGKGQPAAAGTPNDFDAAFNARAAKP